MRASHLNKALNIQGETMASLDFEVEKQKFREFYNDNHDVLEKLKIVLLVLLTQY